jgi:F-type H+-transporting ATPase subunit a
MEHPFTWYALLPHDWQANLQQHTFFALMGALFVLLFAWRGRAALARAQDPAIPAADLGVRNIAELLIGLVVSQSDAIIGKQGRKFVPYFGTFFLFILFSNLIGLLPGFSPPTSNLNTTVALALISFIGYNVIGLKEMGAGYLRHFVGPMTGLPAQSFLGKLAFVPLLLLSVAFFFVLEFASHLFRPVSLALRLFGNMMGDHIVIEVFMDLTKLVVPVIFYALGTLVSIIQAAVFMLLSMIYVSLAIAHGHDESHGHEQEHAHQSSH